MNKQRAECAPDSQGNALECLHDRPLEAPLAQACMMRPRLGLRQPRRHLQRLFPTGQLHRFCAFDRRKLPTVD